MFTGLRDRLATLKRLERKKKIAFGVLMLFMFLLVGYVVGALAGLMSGISGEGLSLGLGSCLVRGIFRWSGLRFTILLFIILLVFVLLVITRENVINQVRETDARGVKYMEKGTYGTTRWMNSVEAKDAFEVSANPDSLTDFIYGTTRDTLETVAFKQRYKVDGVTGTRNRHNFVIGPSGSGKTHSIIKTAILQAIKRNESFVCTDPKGELAREYAVFCKEQGMETCMLNLMNTDYSDGWNCLMEVIDPKTERIDTKLLSEFVTCYLLNASMYGKPGDEFWMAGAINILSAVIALLAWKREDFIREALISAAMSVYTGAGYVDPKGEIPDEILNDRLLPLTEAKTYFRSVAKEHFFTEEQTEKIINDIYEAAPEFDIAAVYYYVVYLDRGHYKEMADDISVLPQEHEAWISYSSFTDSKMSDNVKTSTVNGVMLRLQLFKDIKMRKVLSCDGINMRDINRKKTAFFVVIPKDSEMLRPLLALFFKFMFRDAMETWDAYEERCADEGTEVLEYLRPVNVIMEEAYSIGYIPNFPRYMSVVRSYRLDVTIIVQNITELPELYGPEGASTIRAQCDTFLFLGCNDPETAKDISIMLGEVTVQSQSRRESTSLFVRGASEIDVSESSRPLLTPAEARGYGGKHRIIVSAVGCNPLDLDQFPYTAHKMYRYLQPASFASMRTPLSERFPKEDVFRRKEAVERNLAKNTNGKEKSEIELLFDIMNRIKEQARMIMDDNSVDMILSEDTAGSYTDADFSEPESGVEPELHIEEKSTEAKEPSPETKPPGKPKVRSSTIRSKPKRTAPKNQDKPKGIDAAKHSELLDN